MIKCKIFGLFTVSIAWLPLILACFYEYATSRDLVIRPHATPTQPSALEKCSVKRMSHRILPLPRAFECRHNASNVCPHSKIKGKRGNGSIPAISADLRCLLGIISGFAFSSDSEFRGALSIHGLIWCRVLQGLCKLCRSMELCPCRRVPSVGGVSVRCGCLQKVV